MLPSVKSKFRDLDVPLEKEVFTDMMDKALLREERARSRPGED